MARNINYRLKDLEIRTEQRLTQLSVDIAAQIARLEENLEVLVKGESGMTSVSCSEASSPLDRRKNEHDVPKAPAANEVAGIDAASKERSPSSSPKSPSKGPVRLAPVHLDDSQLSSSWLGRALHSHSQPSIPPAAIPSTRSSPSVSPTSILRTGDSSKGGNKYKKKLSITEVSRLPGATYSPSSSSAEGETDDDHRRRMAQVSLSQSYDSTRLREASQGMREAGSRSSAQLGGGGAGGMTATIPLPARPIVYPKPLEGRTAGGKDKSRGAKK